MLSNGHAGAAKLWPTGFICSLLIIFYSLFCLDNRKKTMKELKVAKSIVLYPLPWLIWPFAYIPSLFCRVALFLIYEEVTALPSPFPSPLLFFCPFPSSLSSLPSVYHLSSLKIFLIIFLLFCVCVLCGHMRGSQKTTSLSHLDPGDQIQVIRTGATVTHRVTLLACPSFWDWVLCRLA